MRTSVRLPLALISFLISILFFATARSAGSTSAIFSDTESTHLKFQAGFWGCTYSQGYWKNHPDDWPVTELTLGLVQYSQIGATEIIKTPPKGDATYILAHQLIAAKLNFMNGANPQVIEDSIDAADAWLVDNPIGSDPQDEERESGIGLSESLESFNTGEIWPGACDDDITEDDDTEESEDLNGEEKEQEEGPGSSEEEAEDPDKEEDELEDGDQAENSGDSAGGSNDEAGECNRDIDYWSSRKDAWSVQEIAIGGLVYSADEAVAILQVSSDEHITYHVAQQLLLLRLNLYGLEIPSDIQSIIDEADRWLTSHPLGTNPSEADREEGLYLSRVLGAHNKKLAHSSACVDDMEELSQEGDDESEATPDQKRLVGSTEDEQAQDDFPPRSESPDGDSGESEEEPSA